MKFLQYLKIPCKETEKCKIAIPSLIDKLSLNSWNIKYSQNMTCICRNVLSVNHILPECPITTELFQKNGYDVNATKKEIFCIIFML